MFRQDCPGGYWERCIKSTEITANRKPMRDILYKINYILDRRQKLSLVFLFLCMIVNAAFELLGIGVIYPVIDLAMNPDAVSTNAVYARIYDFFGFSGYRQFVLALITTIVVLFAVKTVFLVFFRKMQLRFRYGNTQVLASKLLGVYMAQPYSFFARNNSASLRYRIQSDTYATLTLIFDLMLLVVNSFTALCIGILMFVTNPVITMVLLAVMAVLVLLYFMLFKRRLLRCGDKNRHYGTMVNLWLQQSIDGIKETKVLGREGFFLRQFNTSYKGYARAQETSSLLNSLPNDILLSVCISSVMVTLGFLVLAGGDMSANISSLSIFALSAFRIFPCVSVLSSYLGEAFFMRPSLDALYASLHEAVELGRVVLQSTGNGDAAGSDAPLPFQKSIELRNVTFGYEGAPGKVFEHADISIPRNSAVAFIGPSGAGKTTAADLVLGLLDPDEGAVLVDGTDIKGHKSAWLQNIGYIPQSIYLSDDTIRNNIAFGLPPEEIDDAKVWKAAEQAQLASYIRSLPDGLDTYIGERGIRMSGGQRQRVGIARALYNDPEVLVLDEATSALDSETEAMVMESIDSLSGRKTLLIIAHRLTTIRNCNIVYEIKDGKVRRAR